MNIEIFVKIFTLIGSVLGAIAFFQNISKDIASTNKEKWNKLNSIITIVDLENLGYGVVQRRISGTTFSKIDELYYIIKRQDLDLIGFKSSFKDKISEKFLAFADSYEEFRKYVQVPFWNPFDDHGKIGYEFDKQVFFEEACSAWSSSEYQKATNAYSKHLEAAEIAAEKMEKVFAEIQRLATKDAFEHVLPWKWK